MKVGVVWVQSYPTRQADLRLSRTTTDGFVNILGGTRELNAFEANAVDILFQPPNAPVNDVDIVYFSGHGSLDGPIFEVANRNNGVASYSEVQLGGASLKIAVFDCCRALQRRLQWRPAFQGLRWLLGFSADVPQRGTRGAVFAKLLLDRPPKPVGEAWERAAIETGGAGIPVASIQATDRDGEIPRDVLSLDGGLPHPTAARFFVARTELPDAGTSTPEEDERESPSKVKLFQVKAPAWTGVSLADICQRLEVSVLPQHDTPDFHRFGGGTLDVFRASDSIWWTREHSSNRALFGKEPNLPASREAIEQAMRFLREKRFLPSEIWQTWTTRTQELHAEQGERRNEELVTARHVHVTFQLDGLPVMGPGAKTRVSFESRQVDAFHQLWQQPAAYEEVRIINGDQAKRRVYDDEAFRRVRDVMTLGKPQLGYYAAPAREKPYYLLPVWAVPGTVTTPATEYTFERFVLAVKEDEIGRFPELEELEAVFS